MFNLTTLYRFWTKVHVAGLYECWEWVAAKQVNGYGQLTVDAKHTMAHRMCWEMFHGPIPAGMVVMHSCDNPRCVNPAHLSIGTTADNMRDCVAKGRAYNGDPKGERNGRAKLTEEQVKEIRAMLRNGCRRVDIAHRFGVTPSAIGFIKNGEHWPDIY